MGLHKKIVSVPDITEKQPIEDDDPDDPIVHEIPVFLAKSLANQLYLLQYPGVVISLFVFCLLVIN